MPNKITLLRLRVRSQQALLRLTSKETWLEIYLIICLATAFVVLTFLFVYLITFLYVEVAYPRPIAFNDYIIPTAFNDYLIT
tara:strand:- start:1223 stop:1468 length:246 start_codon:yes stop_codon:yes gene_type:complete